MQPAGALGTASRRRTTHSKRLPAATAGQLASRGQACPGSYGSSHRYRKDHVACSDTHEHTTPGHIYRQKTHALGQTIHRHIDSTYRQYRTQTLCPLPTHPTVAPNAQQLLPHARTRLAQTPQCATQPLGLVCGGLSGPRNTHIQVQAGPPWTLRRSRGPCR